MDGDGLLLELELELARQVGGIVWSEEVVDDDLESRRMMDEQVWRMKWRSSS